MNEIDKRNSVAKWTSLWIFVPIVGKIIYEGDINISILDVLVFCSGIASFNHWSHNINGGWRHLLDIFLAISTIAYSIYFNQLSSCMVNQLIWMIIFFLEQRFIQYNKEIEWFNVMIFHSLFRYAAFWFVINIYFPYLCNIDCLSTYLVISFIYFIHVMVIYKKI